jgi:hypothetical protein
MVSFLLGVLMAQPQFRKIMFKLLELFRLQAKLFRQALASLADQVSNQTGLCFSQA